MYLTVTAAYDRNQSKVAAEVPDSQAFFCALVHAQTETLLSSAYYWPRLLWWMNNIADFYGSQ